MHISGHRIPNRPTTTVAHWHYGLLNKLQIVFVCWGVTGVKVMAVSMTHDTSGVITNPANRAKKNSRSYTP